MKDFSISLRFFKDFGIYSYVFKDFSKRFQRLFVSFEMFRAFEDFTRFLRTKMNFQGFQRKDVF